MGSTIRKRKRYEGFLEQVPLLKDLDKWERLSVADALEPLEFKENEVKNFTARADWLQVILKQGDKGDDFFIILDGKVEVTQTNEHGETGVVGQLSNAQYFGMLASIVVELRGHISLLV